MIDLIYFVFIVVFGFFVGVFFMEGLIFVFYWCCMEFVDFFQQYGDVGLRFFQFFVLFIMVMVFLVVVVVLLLGGGIFMG